jgi:hypothetical protein
MRRLALVLVLLALSLVPAVQAAGPQVSSVPAATVAATGGEAKTLDDLRFFGQAPLLASCSASTTCPTYGGGSSTLSCSTSGSGPCLELYYGVRCGSFVANCACYRPLLAECGHETCVCDCYAAGGTGPKCAVQCECPF